MNIKASVIVLSDKASVGARVDTSGEYIVNYLKARNYSVIDKTILPDDYESIRSALETRIKRGIDLIITTGGTGLGPRDVTPEATMAVIDKRLYAMEILMINIGLRYTHRAALSRGVVGICQETLIINLPGSKRAVEQLLPEICEVIPHAIEIIKGRGGECGT